MLRFAFDPVRPGSKAKRFSWLELPGSKMAERLRPKTLWLITARADPAAEVTEPLEAMLRMTAQWMGQNSDGALHAIASDPGEVLQDTAALAPSHPVLPPLT